MQFPLIVNIENAASGRNGYYFMCDIHNPDPSILADDIVEARVVTTKLIASSSSIAVQRKY